MCKGVNTKTPKHYNTIITLTWPRTNIRAFWGHKDWDMGSKGTENSLKEFAYF